MHIPSKHMWLAGQSGIHIKHTPVTPCTGRRTGLVVQITNLRRSCTQRNRRRRCTSSQLHSRNRWCKEVSGTCCRRRIPSRHHSLRCNTSATCQGTHSSQPQAQTARTAVVEAVDAVSTRYIAPVAGGAVAVDRARHRHASVCLALLVHGAVSVGDALVAHAIARVAHFIRRAVSVHGAPHGDTCVGLALLVHGAVGVGHAVIAHAITRVAHLTGRAPRIRRASSRRVARAIARVATFTSGAVRIRCAPGQRRFTLVVGGASGARCAVCNHAHHQTGTQTQPCTHAANAPLSDMHSTQ